MPAVSDRSVDGVADQFGVGDLGVDDGAFHPDHRGRVRLGAGDPAAPSGQVRQHGADVGVGHDDRRRPRSAPAAPVPRRAAASFTASEPAVWNAASEESTLCDLPSSRVTRTSTTGMWSLVETLVELGPHALLDRADELRRHGAADDLLGELHARSRGAAG